MNFFDAAFQTPISVTEFGLCDNGKGGRAYADCENPASWIAIVKNPNADNWTFTAIDKGVIAHGTCAGRGRCDGMLTKNGQTLVLVELKDQMRHWIPPAIQQLEDTIKLFRDSHPTEWAAFSRKRAYACNKQHPQFLFLLANKMKTFREAYQVRLHVEATISL